MKTIAAFALGVGFVLFAGLTAAQEKKGDAPKLEGKYKLISGKVNGKDIDDDAKKAEYAFTSDKITIKGKDASFVMSYKLDPKADPVAIDMDIVEGPEGAKGAKAQGIVELKGDTLKLAYTLDKDKRPKNFDGKDGNLFELKKQK